MKIPKQIKIGGMLYTVERPPQPIPSCDNTIVIDGEHVFFDSSITVCQRGSEAYQDIVFLHEVCHAIIAHYCNDQQDENFVEQFSKGLYQVIVDNNDVFVKGGE